MSRPKCATTDRDDDQQEHCDCFDGGYLSASGEWVPTAHKCCWCLAVDGEWEAEQQRRFEQAKEGV